MPRITDAAPSTATSTMLSFNEAAAECRGLLEHHATTGHHDRASMRPRLNAADYSPEAA